MWRAVSVGSRLLRPVSAAAGGAVRPQPLPRVAGALRGGCAAAWGAAGGAGAPGAVAERRQAAGRRGGLARRAELPGLTSGSSRCAAPVAVLLTSRSVLRSASLVTAALHRPRGVRGPPRRGRERERGAGPPPPARRCPGALGGWQLRGRGALANAAPRPPGEGRRWPRRHGRPAPRGGGGGGADTGALGSALRSPAA